MLRHPFVIACAALAVSAVIAGILTLPQAQKVVENIVPSASPDSSIRVLFVGDIMLDRSVAAHAREVGDEALFVGVQNLFAGHDALIGNLEGTLTTNPSIAEQDNTVLRFTFAPRFAELLAGLGFSAVSLANNHALDFGEFGYEQTLDYLSAVNVGAFGSPFNDAHIALKLSVKEKALCMVGYHSLFRADYSAVTEKVGSVRSACDYVVVMAHWGDEYQLEPNAQQQEAAYAFIDAGADVVIGAHPHVVEPIEIYKGRAIFYSLGNFLFDQGWRPEVKRGLAVGVEFKETSTRFTLTPVSTFKEAAVATGTVAEAVRKDLVTSDMLAEMAQSILMEGVFELPRQDKSSSPTVI